MNAPLPPTSTWMLSICACSPIVSSARLPTGVQELAGPPAAPTAAHDRAAQISEYVREVFQDRDGDYWFGTNGDGVCRYDGKSLTYLSVDEGFGGRAVRGILQDDGGAMWFATDGGVSRYESGEFTNYTTADGLSHDEVWSIMRDSAGTIWVGTHGGVCRFDGESFVSFPLPRVAVEDPASRFSPDVVFAMFEDQAGNLWFGTDGEGVHKYDDKSPTASVGPHGPTLPFTTYTTADGLAGNLVRCITGDRHGRIWIGTDGGGVSCFDGTTFRNFTAEDGLNNDRVFEVLEDRTGNMWLSTLGAGACRYDGESFTAFREDPSLMINGRPARGHVQELFEDEDGVLWLGCSGGLFRFEGESIVNVTREGPWPVPARESAPVEGAGPMASFARMLPGEWRVTFQSGTSLFDTWNWGPGEHSMRVQTDGSGAAGEPWRAVRVFYWHPGRQQVCLLGLSPFARGVSEGTMEFAGESAEAVFDLYQTYGRREMGLRWTFDGPDEYHETLLEATGAGGLEPLNELDYVRVNTLTAVDPRADLEAPRPSMHLQALEPLVGHTWEARGDGATGDALHIQSTFEWVPYADYVYARSVALDEAGKSTHLLDAYFYHHTGTDALRCLALSNRGGVHEGELTVLGDGALQFALKRFEGNQVGTHVVRLDLEKDGTLRDRVWSLEGTERTLMSDTHHRKLEPNED